MKAFAFALVLLAISAPLHARIWTTSDGETIDGEYLRSDAMQVAFKKRDGTIVHVLRSLISEEDLKILPRFWTVRAEDKNPFAKPIAAPWEPQEYSPREVKPVPAILKEQSLWEVGKLTAAREMPATMYVSETIVVGTVNSGTIKAGTGTLKIPARKPAEKSAEKPAGNKGEPAR